MKLLGHKSAPTRNDMGVKVQQSSGRGRKVQLEETQDEAP